MLYPSASSTETDIETCTYLIRIFASCYVIDPMSTLPLDPRQTPSLPPVGRIAPYPLCACVLSLVGRSLSHGCCKAAV